jgi:CheY-like chemotaxis protein
MTKILVADDEIEVRERLRQMLEGQGYQVETADGPEEALEKFQSTRPDVALIDYRLINGNPNDISGILVAAKSDPLIPKIMMSNLAEREEIMQAVNTNAEGFALAVRFLSKSNIYSDPSGFFEAVRVASQIRIALTRRARESIGPELYKHYKTIWNLLLVQLITLIVAGFMLAMVGVYLIFVMHATFKEGLIAFTAAVISELLLIFLIKKGEPLFEMAKNQHRELAERAKFEQVLEACEKLETSTRRDEAKRALIQYSLEHWLQSQSPSDDGVGLSAYTIGPPSELSKASNPQRPLN